MWRKMVEVPRSVQAQAQRENLATTTSAVSFNLFFNPDECMGQKLPFGTFPLQEYWLHSHLHLTILLQLLDMERMWIGISAQAVLLEVVLAHTKRATVTLIASACKTMSVDQTTALISGVMRTLMLIAVSQVIQI